MRYLLATILLAPAIVFATNAPANVRNINGIPIEELPMYGGYNFENDPEAQEFNQKFIDTIMKESRTRTEGAEKVCSFGWKYFSDGDTKTAMKRFNQAWLLDPNYYGEYWGFGVLLAVQKDLDKSISMFEKAFALQKNKPGLIVDYARTCTMRASATSVVAAKSDFARAEELFQLATKVDPKFEPAYSQWAVKLYREGDFEKAQMKLNKAKELGGKSINSQFEKELNNALSKNHKSH